MVEIYFSDYFGVDPQLLERYGAFNISLISDLPLFVDPFLLFTSPNSDYRALHDRMIAYLRFLRDRAAAGELEEGHLGAWFMFAEVKQTWFGYSAFGNSGSGLGWVFARALNRSLHTIFAGFGREQITKASHLEKLCLIRSGVGRDNISDFTTNLTKDFLLDYTQRFAQEHLPADRCRTVSVDRVHFDYETMTWRPGTYTLPWYRGDYVILTPRDILTKDETWINRGDLLNNYDVIANSIPNDQLRAQLSMYFATRLSNRPTAAERQSVLDGAIAEFPDFLDYYIRYKEERGDQARRASRDKVHRSEDLYVSRGREFASLLESSTRFYQQPYGTYEEARERLQYLKDAIENKGCHKLFYVEGVPIRREEDFQILYRLVWYGTPSDVTREANDGRGPADFKVSRGAKDKSLVELKLATNTQLRRNLEHQTAIYERASDAKRSLKGIIYFTEGELLRVKAILKDLQLENSPDVILIDARSDNKPSGSKARSS